METQKNQYLRLLKTGDIKQEGDLYGAASGTGGMILLPCHYVAESVKEDSVILRPVQVEEWVPMEERKPTKDDADKYGNVQVYYDDGRSFCYPWGGLVSSGTSCSITHWRRIAGPPVQIKRVIVVGRMVVPNPDGSIKLSCGTTIPAKDVDEIIRQRTDALASVKLPRPPQSEERPWGQQ